MDHRRYRFAAQILTRILSLLGNSLPDRLNQHLDDVSLLTFNCPVKRCFSRRVVVAIVSQHLINVLALEEHKLEYISVTRTARVMQQAVLPAIALMRFKRRFTASRKFSIQVSYRLHIKAFRDTHILLALSARNKLPLKESKRLLLEAHNDVGENISQHIHELGTLSCDC